MKYIPECNETFSTEKMTMIKNSAFGIIENIGMRVTDINVRSKLLGNGFAQKMERITYPSDKAAIFLDEMIAKENKHRYQKKETINLSENKRIIDGWINNYPHSYYDPSTDNIVPYTMKSLADMTAFCDRVCQKYNLTPNVPGYPSDVPSSCEALARFVVGSKYLKNGTYPEPMSRYSTKYLFEMCDILGKQMNSLPVYLSTPLTIGDESFYIVLENQSRLQSVSIGTMPSFGANTPLSISGSIALNLAEALLGAIIVNNLTGLDVHFGVNLLPFDFASTNQTFGTPEMLLLTSACQRFNNALFGRSGNGGNIEIHTHSIHPDSQAAAEKAMSMAAGYMRHEAWESIIFRGMGTLAMDEVFSPVQLLVDAELVNYIRRFETGYEIDDIQANFLDEIRDGIEYGFVSSERTANNFKELMYHSGVFSRSNLGKQMQDNNLTLEKRLLTVVKTEMNLDTEMLLEPTSAAALDCLLERAIKNAT